MVTIQTKEEHKAGEKTSPISLLIQQVHGNNTQLTVTGPNSSITTYMTVLNIDTATKEAGKVLKLEGIMARGKHLQYTGQEMSLKTGAYELADKAASHISEIQFTRHTEDDSITATIPQVYLVPDITAIAAGAITAEEITLQGPMLKVKRKAGASETSVQQGKPWPVINIKKLLVERPRLQLEQSADDHTIALTWEQGSQAGSNQMLFKNISHTGQGPLTIENISITGDDVLFTRNSAHPLYLKPQSIQLVLDKTTIATGKHHPVPWSTVVEQLTIKKLQVDGLGQDSGQLDLSALSLEHLSIQAKQNYREWLNKSPRFLIKEFSGEFKNSRNYFYWTHLNYRHPQKLLTIDSFAYTPVQDRDTYIAAHPFQTDYIQVKTGKISIHNPNLHGYLKDTLAEMATVQINGPSITVFRDKRLPFQKGVIKPLPVNMIKQGQFKWRVDSVLVHNGYVRYEELSEKTGQTGVISITQLNASLAGIKSHDHHHTDSLKLHADGYIMDSIQVNLRLDESYTDPLAAFQMTLRVSPANLVALNKATEPLASVRIRSGHLDTLTLKAIGREYIAYGEMQTTYRRLNVQFLKAGDEETKNFMTKMVTFLANSFVIKRHNEHTTGIIYFERLRNRSIFNYMIKMFLSGAGTSIGAKSNKKNIRHYRREIRRQKLPEIHLN